MTVGNHNKCSKFEELSHLEQERLVTLFNQLDVNKDGKINAEDLVVAFKEMGIPYTPDGCIQVRVEKRGFLNFNDFFHFIQESEHRLMDLFKYMDENRDGIIDADEIVSAFAQYHVKIEKEEAIILLKRMDKDDSQTISFNEWRDYLLFLPSFELRDLLRSWRHATFLDIGENSLVPDFTKKEIQTGAWWRHLVAGAIAGGVSRTMTAPLDRIKVFLQVRAGEYSSIRLCVRHMLKEGGFKSLWRGNGVNVLKIAPETALKFAVYEQLKPLVRGDSERDLQIYERLIAASIAGSFSQSVIYPLEVLKTRLTLRKTGQYKNAWDAACKIYRREGVRSFYKGYLPNLLGIIPYSGIDLTIFETLRNSYIAKHPEIQSVDMTMTYVMLACGCASSSCGQLASYPLALIRTRLQAQAVTPDRTQEAGTMLGLFKTIVKKEGVAGLYRGITPNFMKVAPAVSISYAVYEYMRNKLGVKRN